jgi:hypothetical protein
MEAQTNDICYRIMTWSNNNDTYEIQCIQDFIQIIIANYNITSFFRFVNKRAIYRLGIIYLAYVPVHVTDFPVVYVHVYELSSVVCR